MVNDESLAMFAGQFVPVKIVTSGKDWSAWKKQYPYDGKGIPILYVVRADGKSLYAKSGSLKGDDLPRMLYSSLEQSGRILDPGEVEMIQTAVAEAEKHMENELPLLAAKSISQLKKHGQLGELGSFAKAGMRADEIVKQISESALKRLSEASEQTSKNSIPFEDILEIVSIKAACTDFSTLKKEIKAANRKIQSNKTAKLQIKPAELLFRARQSSASEKRSDRKRAERYYTTVIEKHADSPAAKIAREELRQLNPDAPVLDAPLLDNK